MKKVFDKTLFIYAALGLVNYALCALIMLLFRNLAKLDEVWCLWISFFLQTAISFVLNRFVTFRGIEISKYWPLKFVASVAVCYVLAKILLRELYKLLVELPFFVGICDWLYKLLHITVEPQEFRLQLVMLATTFTYCVINYIGQRYFVFRHVKKPEPEALPETEKESE